MNLRDAMNALTGRRETGPQVPFPDDRRTVLVDAEGTVLTGRKARPGDFYARPAAAYIFGGTLPSFEPRDHHPDQRQAARAAYETEELRNRTLLDRAVFYLSQTDDGLRLLSMAKSLEFSFVFDQRKTEARGAAGLLDFQNKLVPLHPETTAQRLMLTLKHELQHMENIKDGIASGIDQTLASFQITNRALEAAARVSEAVAVYESSHTDSQGTPFQFKPPGITQAFAAKLPIMAAAANTQAALKAAASKDWGVFAALIFPAFYLETKTLAYYDRDMLGCYDVEMPKDMKDPKTLDSLKQAYGRDLTGFQNAHRYYHDNFRAMIDRFMVRSDWSHDKIAALLTVGGQKFLTASGAELDLDDPKNLALVDDPQTQELWQPFSEKLARLRENGHKIAESDLPEARNVEENPAILRSLRQRMEALTSWAKTHTVFSAPPPHVASPDAASPANGKLQTFVMPSPTATEAWRHHGSGDVKLAAFARHMADAVMPQRSPNEKVRSAIFVYAHQYGRHAGDDSFVTASRELVEMGLLAPIGAFPPEYIRNVIARMRGAAESRAADERYRSFPDAEKRLFQHWENMAARGVDPLNGEDPSDPRAVRPMDEEASVQAFGQIIADYYKIAPSKSAVSTMTTRAMIEWGRAHDTPQADVTSAPTTLTVRTKHPRSAFAFTK